MYPDNADESIGIAGEFPVIRLDDLREVVEGLERISNPDQSALKTTTDFIGMTNELVRLLNQGRDEADKLLAQLKGVGDE